MGSSRLHENSYRALLPLLRRWREDANLSQQGMAERLGKPQSYVHKCEVGERRLDALEYMEWALALDQKAEVAATALVKLLPRK